MTGLRAIVGSYVLGALLVSLLAAPASAAFPAGTTAFTCKSKTIPGGAGFSKAHCKSADAVASGAEYEHVPIAEGTSTQAEATSKDTSGSNQITKLKATILSEEVELQATEATFVGTMQNSESTTAEHFSRGEGVITYNHVTVVKPPLSNCKVKGEKIVTKNLKATTAGQGSAVKVQPAPGAEGVFATFQTESCTEPAFNGTFEVTGSVKCPVDGATITCSHTLTTEPETLKINGEKAGIEGAVTVSGKDTALGDTSYTPLSVTTPTAPTNGLTAFTCKKKAVSGGAGFSKAHCKEADAVASGAEYEHVSIAEGTETELELTNKDTAGKNQTAKLKTTIAGVIVELQAATVTGTGYSTNRKSDIGEHFNHGGVTITYGNVTVTAPAGKGCVVKGGVVETKPLKRGYAGMSEKLEPATGELFALVVMEGCSAGILNGSWEILGTLACPADGATATCTEAGTTAQGDLKINGSKVGIEQILTASGKAIGAPTYTPLGVTTVGTP